MKSLKAIIISSLILTSFFTGCGEYNNDEKYNDEKTTTKVQNEKDDSKKEDDKEESKKNDDKDDSKKDNDKDDDGLKINFGKNDDDDDDKNSVKVKKGKVNVNVGGIKVDVNSDDDDDNDRVKVDIGGGIKVNVGKDDNDVDIDLGDFSFNLDDIDVDLGDWSFNYDEKLVDENDYEFETDKKVKELGVDINVGNINLKSSNDSKTHLALEYTIYADDEETCQDVRKHIKAVAETNGEKMEIKLVDSSSGDPLDKWLRKNIRDCNVKYDLDIAVPSSISSISAENNVGNITSKGLKGKINCCTNVGDIECSGMEFTDVSKLSTKTGNISAADSKYNADTGLLTCTGDIKFDLPRSGSGNADITISTKTGDINVSGKSSYEIIDEKKKKVSHRMDIISEKCDINLSTNTGKIKLDKE